MRYEVARHSSSVATSCTTSAHLRPACQCCRGLPERPGCDDGLTRSSGEDGEIGRPRNKVISVVAVVDVVVDDAVVVAGGDACKPARTAEVK